MTLSTLLLAALTLNALLCIGMCWMWFSSRRQLKSLHTRLDALGIAPDANPADFPTIASAGKRRLITVELLNPMELAAKESWFVRQFGSLTPALIHKLVYEQARNRVERQMPNFGAKAEVKVHAV